MILRAIKEIETLGIDQLKGLPDADAKKQLLCYVMSTVLLTWPAGIPCINYADAQKDRLLDA